jgi:tetratricopeptide (TPR) repeat protein
MQALSGTLRTIAVLSALLTLQVSSAAAAPNFVHIHPFLSHDGNKYRHGCIDGNLTPTAERIDDCTHIIEGGDDAFFPEERAAALVDRGAIYMTLGQNEQAVQDFTKAIQIMPSLASAYINRGHTYFNLGKLELAIQDYDQAIRLDPKVLAPLYGQGVAYESMGQGDRALADFDKAVALVPNNPDLLNARCWERAVTGSQLDMALTDCNSALTLKPDNATALDSRCLVYYRMGNYPAAISDCDEAIKNDDKMSSSLYIGGLAKLKIGDASGGDADIAAAKKIDEKIADTYGGYGVKP